MKVGISSHQRVDKVEEPLKSVGVATVHLSIISSFKNLFRDSPEVVILQDGGFINLTILIISKLDNTPTLLRLGGDPWRCDLEKIKEHMHRKSIHKTVYYLLRYYINSYMLFPHVNGYIVVSKDLRDKVKEKLSLSGEEIKVVHSPVLHTESFEDSSKVKSIDTRKILTITNLRFEGKFRGVKDIIRTLEPLLMTQDIQYSIAGGGLYLDDLIRFIDTMPHIRDQIHILGHVDETDNIYLQSDLFMYYSYFDSYPTVILEAQLAGLPVVSNPAFGITEQIEHNENGWLVDPKSYSENKRLVNNLFQNYEETSKVGLNAKKRVEDHNNKRKIGSILEEFILGF